MMPTRQKLWFSSEAKAIEYRRQHGTGGWVLGRCLFIGDWTPSTVMLDTDQAGRLI